jgi:UcrQ family
MGKKVPPHIRGQIEYFTSPYEQRLFSDLFDSKLMMTKMRRKMSFVKDFAPGLILFASVYTWGNATHEKNSRAHRY